jgi:hypothetical protein
MNRFLKGASMLAALATFVVPRGAAAQIVANGTIDLGGTGLGSVQTILTIKSPGSSSVETGCVSPGGHTIADCGFVDATVQNGQTQTVFLSALGGVHGSNLSLILNFAEPVNAPDGQLDKLVLQLYNDAGASMFTAFLPSSIFYASTGAGTGSSGFLFGLSDASAADFDAAVGAGGTTLGLGSALSSATGGQETFFVGVSDVTVTPEPASMVLLGSGLICLFLVARRRATSRVDLMSA